MRTYSQISMHFGFMQLSFWKQNCVFYKVAAIIQFNWRHKKTWTGCHKIASYAQKRTYAYWDTSNNTSLVHFMGAFVLKTYFCCYKAAKAAAIHFFARNLTNTVSSILWDSPLFVRFTCMNVPGPAHICLVQELQPVVSACKQHAHETKARMQLNYMFLKSIYV